VSRRNEAGRRSGLEKELIMSKEDDFDDIIDSPDELDAGQDDTSEPLLNDESLDESADDEVILEVSRSAIALVEPEEQERAPSKRPAAKKKKKAAKPKVSAKAKTKPKKKAAKPARKPAAKKTAKKTAKKKSRSATKKKKSAAGKPRRKR